MLVEKYIIVGIKQPRDVVTDIVKGSSYEYNLIINPISVIKETREDIFVDYYELNTKSKAIERLSEISKNIHDVKYWSILPIMVDVSTEEARFHKLKKLNKKIKRR